jgi:hypothetical protein
MAFSKSESTTFVGCCTNRTAVNDHPSGLLLRRQKEVGIGHAEGLEDPFAKELVIRHLSDDLDDAGDHVEPDARAVGPACARLNVQSHI